MQCHERVETRSTFSLSSCLSNNTVGISRPPEASAGPFGPPRLRAEARCSRVFQQKLKKAAFLKRSRRVIAEPSHIHTERLHPFQPRTGKPLRNRTHAAGQQGHLKQFPQLLQQSIDLPGASNWLRTHWKIMHSPYFLHYIRGTVLYEGICHLCTEMDYGPSRKSPGPRLCLPYLI